MHQSLASWALWSRGLNGAFVNVASNALFGVSALQEALGVFTNEQIPTTALWSFSHQRTLGLENVEERSWPLSEVYELPEHIALLRLELSVLSETAEMTILYDRVQVGGVVLLLKGDGGDQQLLLQWIAERTDQFDVRLNSASDKYWWWVKTDETIAAPLLTQGSCFPASVRDQQQVCKCPNRLSFS